MTEAPDAPWARLSAWPFGRVVLLAWLAAAAITLVCRWQSIVDFSIVDADDYLRLVEVRDWIGGQGWFDVSQHRMYPPLGGDMHWSRLIDIPIAGLILALSPLLGGPAAELTAMVVVPLLLLGAAMATVAYCGRNLMGVEGGILAALLITISPYLLAQFAPLRIDHHGWQIVMAGVALLALLDHRPWRSGVVAGVAAAFWTHVSLEGLPYLALIGALLGVRYVLDGRESVRLVAYLSALAAASLLFFVATKSPATWLDARCDSFTAPYLLPLVGVTAAISFGMKALTLRDPLSRLALLGASAVLGVGLMSAVSPACLDGPFEALDPLVHRFWYENVREGLPLWSQPVYLSVAALWPSLIGIVGAWLGWRSSRTPDEARRWATLGIMLVGAIGVSLLVFRAQAVAHLYAMIGCAFLLIAALKHIRSLKAAALRVPLTVFAIALPSPIPASETAALLHMDRSERTALKRAVASRCVSVQGLSAMARLPGTLIMAPIDLGPAMLASTSHSAVAGGYHRNNAAMRDIILAFTGPDDRAERTARRHGASLVAYCRNLQEVDLYKTASPNGFMAQLERGRVPDWLAPVPVAGSPDLRVYRVLPAR